MEYGDVADQVAGNRNDYYSRRNQQNNLWNQMQGYGSQLGNLQTQLTNLQGALGSGSMMSPNDQGYMTVEGGINRYGQSRPDTVLMRGPGGELDPRFMQTMSPEFLTLQQKAMTEGDTVAAKLARERLGILTQADKDALQKQASSSRTAGMRNLAMRGGAGLGSRERLNRDISRGLMTGQQGIGREKRLADLAISTQDETMKNQLLGQVGTIAQKVQEANINRLQQDVMNQNMAAQKMYEEDMRAYGAQKTAEAQSAAACFTGNTKVLMEDGSKKKISDVRIGDQLKTGGTVYFTCQAISVDIFIYDGKDHVAGSHAVKEDGQWIRIKDSEKSKRIDDARVVFNLGCDKHIIETECNTYSDFFETDDYEELSIEESLEALNEKLD